MNRKILSIIIGIIIVGSVGYYIYTDISSIQTASEESKVELPSGMNIEGEGGYTVEINPVNDKSNIPVPNLDEEIVFGSNIPFETQNKLRQEILEVISELKKDSNFLDNWISLGLYMKTIGDYDRAKEAWEYAIVLNPSNSVSHHNLGDLYAYFLKDNVKAEENFLKAIENAPSDIYLYFKMSEFYMDVMGDIGKARAIVERGMEANPNSDELKQLLDSL